MKIIDSGWYIEDEIDGKTILSKIEKAGRTCYKSEAKITDESAKRFVSNIIKRGHESVLEHEKITVRFTCDRGISHEIVRHRLASYSQESTRYCCYSNDKFGGLTFIRPVLFKNKLSKDVELMYKEWLQAMNQAEEHYNNLISLGAKPELARGVLPTDVKTEIVVTMNLREWRHFFKMRCDKAAHPNIRYLACGLCREFKNKIPVVFDDIELGDEL